MVRCNPWHNRRRSQTFVLSGSTEAPGDGRMRNDRCKLVLQTGDANERCNAGDMQESVLWDCCKRICARSRVKRSFESNVRFKRVIGGEGVARSYPSIYLLDSPPFKKSPNREL